MQQVKLVLMRMMSKHATGLNLIVTSLRQLGQQRRMGKKATVVRLISKALL